jgi:predicted SAM-dependent methyltransferase
MPTKKKSASKQKRPARRKPLKLNLGCGPQELKGYVNIDRSKGTEAYPLVDIEDGSCDEIRASHLLEHFSYQQTGDVVGHWVSKLRPGGWLKLAVPDFAALAKAYDEKAPFDVQKFIMGGQTDANDFHSTLYDIDNLLALMASAGLYRMQRWESEIEDCASLPISLNVMGQKPSGTEWDGSKVRAVAGMARFGPSLHQRCVHDATTKLGLMLDVQIGCFWHKNLCESIEHAIEQDGVEYVLTLDYDTIFAPDDILELFFLLKRYPALAAVAATQSKRIQDKTLLLGYLDKGRKLRTYEMAGDITQVDTAHFGLTFLRAELLRSMPRPWMVPQPNPDTQRWDDACVDPDIAFWRVWKEAGNTLGVANKVVVGHMEEVVTWPGIHGQAVYQYYGDYYRKGRPTGVGVCGDVK